MDIAVVKLNIAHFKLLLLTETDAAKREVIAELLSEEELSWQKS